MAMVEVKKAPNLLGLSVMDAAKAAAASHYFKGVKNPSQAAVKIVRGQELGIGPIAALEGLKFIKEQLTMSANLMAAVVQNSGRFRFRVKAPFDDKGCHIEFFEREKDSKGNWGKWELVGVSSFGPEDAKKAKLSGDNYQKYPRNMYYARAMSNGCKWYCPAAFSGPVYLPDEIPNSGLKVDGDSLEVIDTEIVEDSPSSPNEELLALWNELAEDRKQAHLDYYGKAFEQLSESELEHLLETLKTHKELD